MLRYLALLQKMLLWGNAVFAHSAPSLITVFLAQFSTGSNPSVVGEKQGMCRRDRDEEQCFYTEQMEGSRRDFQEKWSSAFRW